MEDYLALADDSAVAILPHALRIAGELGIADALADGSASADELAAALEVDARALRRLLRALTSAGFVRLSDGSRFEPRCAGNS